MSAIFRVFRAEGYRLLRARASGAILVALFAVSGLRVVASWIALGTERAERVAEGRAPLTTAQSGDAWAPFVEGWRAGLILVALVLLIHAARGLAGDRRRGLLRLALTRGASRVSLVLGRVLLAPFLIVVLVAVTGAGAYLGAHFLFDFGPLVEDGYELLSVAELTRELRLAILVTLPPLLALYAFGIVVSSMCRTAAQAVGLSLTLFLAFDLFKEALGQAQYWVFAAFTPSFLDGSAMNEMAGMARGFSDAGFSAELVRMNLWLPLPEAAILVVLASLVLSRRSL